jgi:hypothetical protein
MAPIFYLLFAISFAYFLSVLGSEVRRPTLHRGEIFAFEGLEAFARGGDAEAVLPAADPLGDQLVGLVVVEAIESQR